MDVRFQASSDLSAVLGGQRMLEDVVRWLHSEGGDITDIVVQDEYCHDVIATLKSGTILVYDTT